MLQPNDGEAYIGNLPCGGHAGDEIVIFGPGSLDAPPMVALAGYC